MKEERSIIVPLSHISGIYLSQNPFSKYIPMQSDQRKAQGDKSQEEIEKNRKLSQWCQQPEYQELIR